MMPGGSKLFHRRRRRVAPTLRWRTRASPRRRASRVEPGALLPRAPRLGGVRRPEVVAAAELYGVRRRMKQATRRRPRRRRARRATAAARGHTPPGSGARRRTGVRRAPSSSPAWAALCSDLALGQSRLHEKQPLHRSQFVERGPELIRGGYSVARFGFVVRQWQSLGRRCMRQLPPIARRRRAAASNKCGNYIGARRGPRAPGSPRGLRASPGSAGASTREQEREVPLL